MKGRIIWGVVFTFLIAGVVYAQDQMIIFFKDGKTQSIDLQKIQKIEYQATPVASSQTARVSLPLIHHLPNSAFSASSFWRNDMAGHGPPNARMGSTATVSNWSAGDNNPNQWIQVDLGLSYLLRAIGTRGRSRDLDQWVTSYRLSTSIDGVNWQVYQQNGIDVIFRGNSDRETEVRHTLPYEVTARYLRFLPATWHGHITMRIEAYGTQVGIEQAATPSLPLIHNLPNSAFSASSFWRNDMAGHGPPNARMGSTATVSNWSAGDNNPNQWIQVDLGLSYLLRAIGTRGRSRDLDQWVTSYRLSTSIDGVNWQVYQQNGIDVIFRGNSDRETEVRHTLPYEVTARYLRFLPATWHGHITMRIEAYGTQVGNRPAASAEHPWAIR